MLLSDKLCPDWYPYASFSSNGKNKSVLTVLTHHSNQSRLLMQAYLYLITPHRLHSKAPLQNWLQFSNPIFHSKFHTKLHSMYYITQWCIRVESEQKFGVAIWSRGLNWICLHWLIWSVGGWLPDRKEGSYLWPSQTKSAEAYNN